MFGNFHKNRLITLKKIVYSFLGMILIVCQEMDLIELFKKVIFKVGKVRFGPFSDNYLCYSVVMKCYPNLLAHVASLV